MTRMTKAVNRDKIMAIEAVARLSATALGHSGTEEGIACAGTVIEKRTIKTGGKAFLFLGLKDLMLKLANSLPEAEHLAAAEPGNYKAGRGGWVSARLADGDCPPLAMIERWIAESHGLFADAKSGAGKVIKKQTVASKRARAAKGR